MYNIVIRMSIKEKKPVPIGLRMPVDLFKKIKRLAKENRRTFTGQIIIMLERQINANPF